MTKELGDFDAFLERVIKEVTLPVAITERPPVLDEIKKLFYDSGLNFIFVAMPPSGGPTVEWSMLPSEDVGQSPTERLQVMADFFDDVREDVFRSYEGEFVEGGLADGPEEEDDS